MKHFLHQKDEKSSVFHHMTQMSMRLRQKLQIDHFWDIPAVRKKKLGKNYEITKCFNNIHFSDLLGYPSTCGTRLYGCIFPFVPNLVPEKDGSCLSLFYLLLPYLMFHYLMCFYFLSWQNTSTCWLQCSRKWLFLQVFGIYQWKKCICSMICIFASQVFSVHSAPQITLGGIQHYWGSR